MPQEKPILRSHANDVFMMLSDAGLNPSEFEWQRVRSSIVDANVSKLVHRTTGFYFTFDYSTEGHWSEYSPGKDQVIETQHPGDWNNQRAYAKTWVASLKRELESPDLWSSALAESQIFQSMEHENDNALFSPEEQQRVYASLDEIRSYAASALILSAEQIRIVNARLEYLKEAAQRVGRKDWLILAAGVVTNIVVSAAFNPSVTREFFRFFGQALQWIAGTPLLP